MTTSRPASVPPKCFRARRERFVRALQDALRADVDPRAGRHLAVHREPEPFEPAKLVAGRPARHEVRIGDQHARRFVVRADDADRLAALHEQRFVVFEPLERGDDGVETLAIAGRLARSAVDDQFLGPLRDGRVEIVAQHPQGGFLMPAFAFE